MPPSTSGKQVAGVNRRLCEGSLIGVKCFPATMSAQPTRSPGDPQAGGTGTRELRQQIGHGDGDVGPRERRDRGAPAENLDVEVTPAELRGPIARGLAVDLERLVH